MKSPHLLGIGILSILLTMVLLSASMQAQGKKRKVKYKGNTVLDFDDAYIEGDGSNPIGTILLSQKSGKSDSFIKIRKHWRREMVNSANLVSNRK